MGSVPHMGATGLGVRQALEAASIERFMVSSGRLGEGCGWERSLEWLWSGPWREQQVHCAGLAVLDQHLLSLPVLGGCCRAGSIKPALFSHPHYFLHACLKPALKHNSTALFIPQAANSSSTSQPGLKGLRWDVNFKAGLAGHYGDPSSVGHGCPCRQVPHLHAVKSRCGIKAFFQRGHD